MVPATYGFFSNIPTAVGCPVGETTGAVGGGNDGVNIGDGVMI
jgi:hypothetical protein